MLAPFDAGSINRARSAVPLHDGLHSVSCVDALIERYAEFGLRAQFRLADVPSLDELTAHLYRLKFRSFAPSLVQSACGELATRSPDRDVDGIVLESRVSRGFRNTFLDGSGDPRLAAERLATVMRTTDTLYATRTVGSEAVAVGVITFRGSLGCVHAMRTSVRYRGCGFASDVLAALLGAARRRNVSTTILQVEANNAPALALYRRAGFTTRWQYRYWSLA